jgi:hypothetical protein
VKSFSKPRKSENRFTQKTGHTDLCPVAQRKAGAVSPGSSRAADTRSGHAELASASSQSNPNASQKTGLAFGNRNGWQDFRFREKFLEREEIGKRFQVENQGFRVIWGWSGSAKLSLLRLDSGVESGTCTEEREET